LSDFSSTPTFIKGSMLDDHASLSIVLVFLSDYQRLPSLGQNRRYSFCSSFPSSLTSATRKMLIWTIPTNRSTRDGGRIVLETFGSKR
jgi:hypothetical protein